MENLLPPSFPSLLPPFLSPLLLSLPGPVNHLSDGDGDVASAAGRARAACNHLCRWGYIRGRGEEEGREGGREGASCLGRFTSKSWEEEEEEATREEREREIEERGAEAEEGAAFVVLLDGAARMASQRRRRRRRGPIARGDQMRCERKVFRDFFYKPRARRPSNST